MALVWSVVSLGFSLFLTPFLMFLLMIIFLASIDKSLGVRRFYVKLLLAIFEWGRQNIETVKKRNGTWDFDESDDESSENTEGSPDVPKIVGHQRKYNGAEKKQNGVLGNSVIARSKDLIMVPEPDTQNNKNHAGGTYGNKLEVNSSKENSLPRPASFETLKREFDPAICLDYIRAGVEAIIEDEVTSRFEAEELKNWNLLTRTNVHYEFISWKLTVLWMLGFAIRYCFLLPLRILICFIGVCYLIIGTFIVVLIPASSFKRWFNKHVYLMSSRIHARSLSAVITVHNKEYMPRGGGICVANHTSPIDVGILSTHTTFSLVASLVASAFIVGCLPAGSFGRWLNNQFSLMCFRIMARSLGAVINFHNQKYKPRGGGICVANHTSPIDVGILFTQTTFSLVMWLTACTAVVGYVPEGSFKRWLNQRVSVMCFGVLSSALSSVISYHNEENRPLRGICVANHTSPIDVLVLMCDNCYSLIGQSHGGFLGIMQRALARASPHIWFERSEVKDREAVAKRLKKHVSDPTNPPILIFPEGTCINNTSVMQFKKGSFEVDGVIYPVAIKYDPRFGDAFWNSSRYSMIQYLYMMMSSWAIVCDVWYLPPMYRQDGESAIDFANRVKAVIARQGGLVDLQWDGQLKRIKPKKEWREKQQEEFSKRLKVE